MTPDTIRTRPSDLKSTALTVLELHVLALCLKITEVTRLTRPLLENFKEAMSGLPWEHVCLI